MERFFRGEKNGARRRAMVSVCGAVLVIVFMFLQGCSPGAPFDRSGGWAYCSNGEAVSTQNVDSCLPCSTFKDACVDTTTGLCIKIPAGFCKDASETGNCVPCP